MTAPNAILRVEHLTKRYSDRTVVDDVSFELGRAEVVALLGANGAGKTTSLRCILGITSFEGAVEIGGWPVRTQGRKARGQIGYVPQLPSMNEDERCDDALTFIADLKSAPRADVGRALEEVRLHDARRLRVGELSGGMRQRLALAAALLGDPKLLLLDEPTASLDAESQAEFERILIEQRDAGRAVLLSTHVLDRVERFVDRAIVLHRGKLAFDGSLNDLRSRGPGRRFMVTVNGHAPGDVLAAMRQLGIEGERVTEVPASWDEIMRAVTSGADEEAPWAR